MRGNGLERKEKRVTSVVERRKIFGKLRISLFSPSVRARFNSVCGCFCSKIRYVLVLMWWFAVVLSESGSDLLILWWGVLGVLPLFSEFFLFWFCYGWEREKDSVWEWLWLILIFLTDCDGSDTFTIYSLPCVSETQWKIDTWTVLDLRTNLQKS